MKSYIFKPVLLALCVVALSEAYTPNSGGLSAFRNSYNYKKCSDCVCGVKNGFRIVGGRLADRRDYPWLVQIKYNGQKWCGGSLVTRRHVITAAHCVHAKLSSRFTIHLADGQHAIRFIREHRQYNPRTYNNDIAIIELYTPVQLSRTVKTICLPEKDAEFDGKAGFVSGWGSRFEKDGRNTELRTVDLPIMSKSQCSRTNYPQSRLTDNMFCAGYADGGKDSCQGDSGGPLEVHEKDASTVLAGVVSWGVGCARKGFPGIYTKVSHYVDWIKTYTNNDCLCPSLSELE